MILLIDNYDSFSYNLYQLIGQLDPDLHVVRNDACTVGDIKGLQPEAVVLSPGPGRPEDAGICVDVIKELGADYPILGVCLGHQAICQAYGGVVTYAKELMHGKQSETDFDTSDALFAGLPEKRPWPDTTPWRRKKPACRTVSKSQPERQTERSWRSDTENTPSTACSSTRNPS